MKKRRWLWFALFIFVVSLIGVLGTVWNLFLSEAREHLQGKTWVKEVFGTIGFVLTLSVVLTFFLRLLKEMKLNQMQTEFLARVSHELKTPIATLELTSSMLRSADLDGEESERLWSSHDEELQRLKVEVEALLEAARIEGTSLKPTRQPVHLESWLNESLARWRSSLGEEGRIDRFGADLRGYAQVDLTMLNLVTNNLISNAKKFALDHPEILVETRFDSLGGGRRGRWQIYFRDGGRGFHPRERKKIFQRFYRSRNGSERAIPGTGLGLYLAQSASRLNGMKLNAESDGVGRGATFILEGRWESESI